MRLHGVLFFDPRLTTHQSNVSGRSRPTNTEPITLITYLLLLQKLNYRNVVDAWAHLPFGMAITPRLRVCSFDRSLAWMSAAASVLMHGWCYRPSDPPMQSPCLQLACRHKTSSNGWAPSWWMRKLKWWNDHHPHHPDVNAGGREGGRREGSVACGICTSHPSNVIKHLNLHRFLCGQVIVSNYPAYTASAGFIRAHSSVQTSLSLYIYIYIHVK